MSKAVGFWELFSSYAPPEELIAPLSEALVTDASFDKSAGVMELSISFPCYIEAQQISRLIDGLKDSCGLKEVCINTAFPEVSLDDEACKALADELIAEYRPAIALLAGAKWELSDTALEIKLAANGKDELQKYASMLERRIESRLGLIRRVRFSSSSELSADELFKQTDDIRRKAVKEAAEIAKATAVTRPKVFYGKAIKGKTIKMSEIEQDSDKLTVCGKVFAVDHRELKNRGAVVISFDMTDNSDSVRVARYMEQEEAAPIMNHIKVGGWYKVYGKMSFNRYSGENELQPISIEEAEAEVRHDTAEEKRVELHLHTRMSAMDALTDTAEAVKQAAKWGHKAIAITDHGVAQSFPDALKAGKKHGIKIIYGLEGYYINDVDDRIVVHGDADTLLTGEFVAFDLETTGLVAGKDEITEIGAVIYSNGELKERFQTFVNPGRPLSREIIELTGITDAMLKDAPSPEDALKAFLDFAGDRALSAHNADFDMSFITEGCRRAGIDRSFTSVDTLIMAQNLLPNLGKYKLNIVADALSLPEFNHHRAVDDAVTVAHMLGRFFEMLKERSITKVSEINDVMSELRAGGRIGGRSNRHIIILAQNKIGLRNLYKLISFSHLKYFKRYPIIPKSELLRNREGLIIGSACESGELFQAVVSGKSWSELKRVARFYDYLEIQPLCNNQFMIDNGKVAGQEQLRNFNRTVVRLGKELGKPVAATGDVHFLDPSDEVYRRILLAEKGFSDPDRPLPLYFKTTDEMLKEFSYLGAEKAKEVVVTAPNLIAEMCEDFEPLPKGLFAPTIEGAEEQLQTLVSNKIERLYGENPPEIITKRVNTELDGIIGRGYAVIYMSAQKLVQRSLDDGYLVGSRGSVGSSMAAYFSGITEVNALPPHYRCPSCKHSDFEVEAGWGCGIDMPDAYCPVCGEKYAKEGFDIPFETFLGFGGDKTPDIDLNFSGEYQAKAHRNTVELFGESHVFRAGTIGTVAAKTAYGYVKGYLEDRGKTLSRAEENRLSSGCVGVKRTTGQHPGGLVIIPGDREVYDFCPVQHPADDTSTDIITTHFEYHSMEENLLKLDLLGHDDPTMLKMLGDLTGLDVTAIPLDDPDTMSIFTSSSVLGFTDDPILGQTGACAIPEFGTKFVREMLIDTQPTKFDTLVKISGFSHGTDVWLNNAKDLIVSKTAAVNQVVSCRDDIMLYLISMKMDEKLAFTIMEAVRKGKGLKDEWRKAMTEAGVPGWYIESCDKIQYLFPKAHAVAYVIMAFRIAWFKVHEPLSFYAAYYTIRATAFDATIMTRGIENITAKMKEINNNKDATQKDKDMLTTLEVCYEFYLRGFTFDKIDIYESDATRFIMGEKSLRPPFVSIPGLGETAALNIVEGRVGQSFISVEEFAAACPKVSKTHMEQLKEAGALNGLPDSNQMSLF